MFLAFFIATCAWDSIGVKFEDLVASSFDSIGEVIARRAIVVGMHVVNSVPLDSTYFERLKDSVSSLDIRLWFVHVYKARDASL